MAALKKSPVVYKKAKDLLRASRLALLPEDNPHVAADLKKIKKGKPLSPILVVRGDLDTDVAMQIADGYHRVCASYYTDENTDIPVRSSRPTKLTAWGFGQPRRRGKVQGVQRVLLLGRRDGA